VFCALGHLAQTAGIAVSDIPYAGFSLVFGTWPVILATLPGGIHWVRLLFFDLFLLGIDSAFAFVECKSKRSLNVKRLFVPQSLSFSSFANCLHVFNVES
jgi:hypothetical protein